MHVRRPAIAAALCLALAAAGPAARAESDRVPGTLGIPCATTLLQQAVDWYIPTGTPRGLIWLQHGFARNKDHIASLAAAFADNGYLVFAPSLPFIDLLGCTLQNLGDNTGFLGNIAALFRDGTGPLARSFASTAQRAHRPELRLPDQFVFVGHSAGAEAVEFVAHRLHTDHPGAWGALRGLILLDPVKSFLGNNTERALADLDGTALPVLTISGPPSLCNAFGGGTAALQRFLHRPYLGLRIGTGVHTDAEGASGDAMGSMLCGTPDSVNITMLHTLALGWAGDFFSGTRTADYYPADAPADDADAARAAIAGAVAAAPTAQILSGS